MNNNDTEIDAKLAARDLIEALHGLSVCAAEEILGLVELSLVAGTFHHPEKIEKYRDKLTGIPQGSQLEAIRLARYVIRTHTEVDMNSEGAAMAFALWSKEAALAGVRLVA